ncbi:hypothetical protein CH306_25845 [Rhodococcus sp. 15-725-2-2b]|nr:hypothetical protein CH277_22815 [Rhodococcus sp. 06-469-3-2]OZD40839.1 hypothetical protein CH264_24500 [Rhodococcus sp. 06-1477-1A]OZE67053.1 hypothetical protein CH306_25845 [Rhodococcus sp. 15-725-2-2b]
MTCGDLGRHSRTIGATASALEKSGLVSCESNPNKPQQLVVALTRRGDSLLIRANRALIDRTQGDTDTTPVYDAIHIIERHCTRARPTAHVHSVHSRVSTRDAPVSNT